LISTRRKCVVFKLARQKYRHYFFLLQHGSIPRTVNLPALAAVSRIILIIKVFNIYMFKVFYHHLLINFNGGLTKAD